MQHYCFERTADIAPFCWIQYESGAEISAFSTYRVANLRSYWLGVVETGEKSVFKRRVGIVAGR
jgi:hypothetical protein